MDDSLRQQRIARARAILNHPGFLAKPEEEQSQMINTLLEKGLDPADFKMLQEEKNQLLQQGKQQNQFQILNNNAFASVLSQLSPREVLKNCQLDRKFATVCRDPEVFKFLLNKHYPNSFHTDKPRQQYIALTTGVETTYRLPFDDGEDDDEDYSEREDLDDKELVKAIKVGPSSKPEDIPGWSLANSGSQLAMISVSPVFAAWVAKDPPAYKKFLHMGSTLDRTIHGPNKHAIDFLDNLFKKFVADYRENGDNIISAESIHREIVKLNGPLSTYFTPLLRLIENFLSEGKPESYKYDDEGLFLHFTVKGNSLPEGTVAWAIIDPHDEENKVNIFKTREAMASHFSETQMEQVRQTLHYSFTNYLYSNPALTHLTQLSQIEGTPEYSIFLQKIELWPFTAETVRDYVLNHDKFLAYGDSSIFRFSKITF